MQEEPAFTLLPMEFRSVVTIIWGPEWWHDGARAFGYSTRVLRRMASGERGYSPTPEMVRELRSIVANSIKEIEGRVRPEDAAFVKRVLRLGALDLSPSNRR